jgi:hypothetical protein
MHAADFRLKAHFYPAVIASEPKVDVVKRGNLSSRGTTPVLAQLENGPARIRRRWFRAGPFSGSTD